MEQRRLAKREYKQANRSNSDWLARAVRGMSGVTDVGRIDYCFLASIKSISYACLGFGSTTLTIRSS
jgi:hypothetical protein